MQGYDQKGMPHISKYVKNLELRKHKTTELEWGHVQVADHSFATREGVMDEDDEFCFVYRGQAARRAAKVRSWRGYLQDK